MEEKRERPIIESIEPQVNGGEHAVKRIQGEHLHVAATIFADGHDRINARLWYKHESQRSWRSMPMSAEINDRWHASIACEQVGAYTWYLEAWADYALNWQHDLLRKAQDGQQVQVELADGLKYFRDLKKLDAGSSKLVKKCLALLEPKLHYDKALELVTSSEVKALFERYPHITFATKSPEQRLRVDRPRGGFSSWYELFPRSAGSDRSGHGTLADARRRLPYVAELGFDVLYFPPLHPIGERHRKGRNNAVNAQPGDVGSPWAIGSRHGGHKAIAPELGTLADFEALVQHAQQLGIEVAMDFALQCAPDHPYVTEHPEWFLWRSDGTVQYAENPPKKYQDIIPFNFECADWQNLWKELLGIVYFWIERGVGIFRVDNPHTKPFRFWQWLIAQVHARHPHIIFLSESFTRPAVMNALAKLGFTQSYTYFTWRNSKAELAAYMDELVHGPSRQYFRPNFWPNTPDILPYELQQPNEAAYILRHFLAATLSANYGMYGPVYENKVYQALPGREEYHNSEKYEVAEHTWDTQGKLKQVIKMVNLLRRHHPALQDTFNYEARHIDQEYLMAYQKSAPDADDHLLLIANFDTYYTREGWVSVNLQRAGIAPDQPYRVHDLISHTTYHWRGEWNFVSINPHGLPFHCFQLLKG